MTKRKIKWGISSLTLIFFTMAFAMPYEGNPEMNNTTIDEEDLQLCFIENRTFQVGEEITYKLYYNLNFVWLAAGEVVFKVSESNDKYHVSANGRTYPTYEWFFKVRDSYESYIDKETLLPHTSIRDVQEGGYKLYDKVNFDQERRLAVSERGKTKYETTTNKYNLDGCIHDVLSIVYYTRNLDFDKYKEGQEIPVKIFMDKEIWPLKVKYKGKEEEKKIKGQGKFKTIKFSPEVIEGEVFKADSEMNIWVSDDGNRIPLLIESALSVGSVKAVLKDYKGLKHKMTSKIE